MPLSIRSLSIPFAIAVLLSGGCATTPTNFPEDANLIQSSYKPLPAPIKIDASASVDLGGTVAGNAGAYALAVRDALTRDLAMSGLFARIVEPTSADFL